MGGMDAVREPASISHGKQEIRDGFLDFLFGDEAINLGSEVLHCSGGALVGDAVSVALFLGSGERRAERRAPG